MVLSHPFSDHAQKKAIRHLMIARKIAGNVWGLNDELRRALYRMVFLPTLLYGAPVWASAIGRRGKSNKRALLQTQRRALVWYRRLYRTTSYVSALVLSDQPPINVLVEFAEDSYRIKKRGHSKWLNHDVEYGEGVTGLPRARMVEELAPYTQDKAKKAIRTELFRRWATEIDRMNLKRLRPIVFNGRLSPVARDNILNFYSTQLLSGHGGFNSFLHYIKKSPTDQCPYGDGRETPEHILVECIGHADLRRSLALSIDDLNIEKWGTTDPRTAANIAKFAEQAVVARTIRASYVSTAVGLE